jgi:hypothetical protein
MLHHLHTDNQIITDSATCNTIQSQKNMDLRDYLVSRGITPKGEERIINEALPVFNFKPKIKNDAQFVEKWNTEEIELFLKHNIIPQGPIQLNQCTTILDTQKFIDTHLAIAIDKNGIPCYKPYFERLHTFINGLTQLDYYNK